MSHGSFGDFAKESGLERDRQERNRKILGEHSFATQWSYLAYGEYLENLRQPYPEQLVEAARAERGDA